MTWWAGVQPARRDDFLAELRRRLEADSVPYHVGKSRTPGGLVFRCTVRGRGSAPDKARAAAFEACRLHEQLLRMEMFPGVPCCPWPALREAVGLIAGFLMLRRSAGGDGDDFVPCSSCGGPAWSVCKRCQKATCDPCSSRCCVPAHFNSGPV